MIASRKEVFPCVTIYSEICVLLSPFAIYINMHRNAPVLQVVVKVPGSESKRVELALFERVIII